MNISMAGVDYKSASLSLREKIAFESEETEKIIKKINESEDVLGCVMVSTCNRTEIYISGTRKINAAKRLFDSCGADYDEFGASVTERYDYEAALYLAEVACGLHSAILCEEQIVTQIGGALELSRGLGYSDAVLNTMFRYAVTAGKKALTEFSVRSVPLSSAQVAADMAERLYGGLNGKNALIIGNGKMGLLAAEALLKKGCGVYITLRRYKHGDNIVPNGAKTIDYSKRAELFGKINFIMSATRSPHYTIFKRDIAVCENKPDYIFDLAVPRDVEPGTEQYVKCFDIDSLGGGEAIDAETINGIKEIAKKNTEDFAHWHEYREGLK